MLEQSAVARLGEAALATADADALMAMVAGTVARTLEVEYAGVLVLNAERDAAGVARRPTAGPTAPPGPPFRSGRTPTPATR